MVIEEVEDAGDSQIPMYVMLTEAMMDEIDRMVCEIILPYNELLCFLI